MKTTSKRLLNFAVGIPILGPDSNRLYYCVIESGVQLGELEDRGLINNKVRTKHFLKRINLEIIFFRFRSKRKLQEYSGFR